MDHMKTASVDDAIFEWRQALMEESKETLANKAMLASATIARLNNSMKHILEITEADGRPSNQMMEIHKIAFIALKNEDA